MPLRAALRLAVAAILFTVCGAAFVLWLTLPPPMQSLRIAGLSAPVHITLDSHGIPRIAAANDSDAATALGFLHARDRMFQMELMRRAASGRLAELAGKAALPLDRRARLYGEARHADAAYAGLPQDTKRLLEAYANGVNAWIGARGRFAAPEFLAFGAPEPWRPRDSLLWNETVSVWLSDNLHTELQRLDLADKLTPEQSLALWPLQTGTPAPDSTALPVRQGLLAPFAGSLLRALPTFPAPLTWPGEASDAWAVDASRSATGAPLLAGDPHLALNMPALWYLARIDTPANTLVGATAPGVPFLILGRNRHIAWSFTSTGADTQDLFVETPAGPGQYMTPDGAKPFETRTERIHVRGAPDDVFTVRTTRHGPVISDLFPAEPGKPQRPIIAAEMAQYEVGSAAPGLLALNRATSVAEAGAAAPLMPTPVQNLTVADANGIALFTTGKIPVRRAGDGAAAVPGADGAHDWTGYAEGDALPHVVDPPSGLVENANERTAPPDFPVFMGRDFPPGYRARRIHQLLDGTPMQTLTDFGAMQADDVSAFAQEILPAIVALPNFSGAAATAQSLLARWHGEMRTDLPQPLIFNAALQNFFLAALATAHVPERDGGPWEGFDAWLLSPAAAGQQSLWCGGDCRALLARAFTEAVGSLSARFGTDPAAWRWGEAHQAIFSHPLLGGLPVIGAIASRRVSVPGDDTTLFRGGSGELGDFASRHGAAYRGLYDLKDPDRSRFVVTPGQSGNIFSAHAWDMLPLWAAGSSLTLAASPDAVTGRIELHP